MSKKLEKHFSLAIILIVIGTVILLKNLGIFNFIFPWYVLSWPTWIFFLFGFIMFASQKWEFGSMLFIVGGAFMFSKIFNFSMHVLIPYWPVLLIVLGVLLLVRYTTDTQHKNHNDHGTL